MEDLKHLLQESDQDVISCQSFPIILNNTYITIISTTIIIIIILTFATIINKVGLDACRDRISPLLTGGVIW